MKKAEENACLEEGRVSRETVMRQVRSMEVPSKEQEEINEKRKVKYPYVETDEDYIREECQTSPESKADYDNMKELLKLKRENEELRKKNLFLK